MNNWMKNFEERIKIEEKAKEHENAGDFRKAADLYGKLNHYEKAANLYFKSGHFSGVGEMYYLKNTSTYEHEIALLFFSISRNSADVLKICLKSFYKGGSSDFWVEIQLLNEYKILSKFICELKKEEESKKELIGKAERFRELFKALLEIGESVFANELIDYYIHSIDKVLNSVNEDLLFDKLKDHIDLLLDLGQAETVKKCLDIIKIDIQSDYEKVFFRDFLKRHAFLNKDWAEYAKINEDEILEQTSIAAYRLSELSAIFRKAKNQKVAEKYSNFAYEKGKEEEGNIFYDKMLTYQEYEKNYANLFHLPLKTIHYRFFYHLTLEKEAINSLVGDNYKDVLAKVFSRVGYIESFRPERLKILESIDSKSQILLELIKEEKRKQDYCKRDIHGEKDYLKNHFSGEDVKTANFAEALKCALEEIKNSGGGGEKFGYLRRWEKEELLHDMLCAGEYEEALKITESLYHICDEWVNLIIKNPKEFTSRFSDSVFGGDRSFGLSIFKAPLEDRSWAALYASFINVNMGNYKSASQWIKKVSCIWLPRYRGLRGRYLYEFFLTVRAGINYSLRDYEKAVDDFERVLRSKYLFGYDQVNILEVLVVLYLRLGNKLKAQLYIE